MLVEILVGDHLEIYRFDCGVDKMLNLLEFHGYYKHDFYMSKYAWRLPIMTADDIIKRLPVIIEDTEVEEEWWQK